MKLIFFICPFILFSCISKGELLPVVPDHIFHSNSAKTWILKRHIVENENQVPLINENKMAFTFYYNHTFRKQKMIRLGSNTSENGSFSFQTNPDEEIFMTLHYYDGSLKKFNVKKMSYTTIQLEKLGGIKEKWELVTLNPPK